MHTALSLASRCRTCKQMVIFLGEDDRNAMTERGMSMNCQAHMRGQSLYDKTSGAVLYSG